MIKKLLELRELQASLDNEVWKVINNYLHDNKINFRDPNHWYIETGDDFVTVSGTDGCRGCYHDKEINIDLRWFEDYDAALAKEIAETEEYLRVQKLKEEKERTSAKEKRRLDKEKRELAIYNKIKKLKEAENGNYEICR